MTPLRTSCWPLDRSAPILDLSAGELLRGTAAAVGERTALVEVTPPGLPSLTGADATDRRWTYRELLADAEACGRWLASRFQPGERVCLWAPNVPEWIIVQFGAALAGLVLVTANPALREEELRHVLRQSASAGLIHVAAFRDHDMSAVARAVAGCVREVVALERLTRTLAAWREGAALPGAAPGDAAQVQFTSGTTGRPKGAVLTHRGLVTNAALVAARTGQRDDVVVTPMPLFHTAGSVLAVLGAVASRSTLVLPLLFDPALHLDAIARENAGVSSGVPTMLAALVEEQQRRPRDLSRLRTVLSGGAPVPPELVRRVEQVLGCRLATVYGQTELSPIVCATSPDDDEARRSGTSGRPLPQVEVRIVAVGPQTVVAPGEEGELQARGYQTMIGYHDDQAANARVFTADGWLRSGDLAIMDADGYVRITGRLSDMIIRGGENVYPAEIEAAMATHPEIAEIAVFGMPDAYWGEVVAAAVRVAPGTSPSAETLRSHCRAMLAPHKTPAHWFAVDALPLTPSGKVRKFSLRDMAERGDLARL